MKLPLLTIALTAAFLCSCNVQLPTESEIQDLISVIPDHRIKDNSEKYFTHEYYSTLEHAWAIPSDAIGGIGSEEWLYYFITGNGDVDDIPEPKILQTTPTTDGVEITFSYMDNEHKLLVVHENGIWKITDYDNTLAKMKEYIATQRKYFKSQEWKTYLHQTRKELGAETVDNAEKEVKAYFLKYK